MTEYLDNYNRDLEDIKNTFNLLKSVENLRSLDIPLENIDSPFLNKSIDIHQKVDISRNGIVKIPGIFVLFIGGRFEDFVKTIFEEFAIQFAHKHQNYSNLPEKFKSTIINNTTQVITSPRKFGFENPIQNTFIENLYKNVINNDLSTINHQCLSFTSGNLRSDILTDLFKIISVENIWKEIGEQIQIRTFFETDNANNATQQAKNYLNNFMNARNNVAHPSGGGSTWPSYDEVLKHIEFFKILGPILIQIGNMKINSITIS